MCIRMTSDGVGRFSLAQGATRDLAVVAVLLCGLAGTDSAAAQSYASLDEAVTKLSNRLASNDRLEGKQVLVNAHDFFEERSGSILPLSATLRERFTTELSSRGLAVFSLPEGSEDNMVILQGGVARAVQPGGRAGEASSHGQGHRTDARRSSDTVRGWPGRGHRRAAPDTRSGFVGAPRRQAARKSRKGSPPSRYPCELH